MTSTGLSPSSVVVIKKRGKNARSSAVQQNGPEGRPTLGPWKFPVRLWASDCSPRKMWHPPFLLRPPGGTIIMEFSAHFLPFDAPPLLTPPPLTPGNFLELSVAYWAEVARPRDVPLFGLLYSLIPPSWLPDPPLPRSPSQW